tara:strand:+ start:2281 stop:3267 length:987 start_codon:yes stop_codon:yes gene_type:complete
MTICFRPIILALVILLTRFSPAYSEDSSEEAKAKSFVYKTVADLSIEADVYSARGEASRPVVLWIHGGALMLGSRKMLPAQILMLCRKENYVLVSIDYRLAPETNLSEIVSDVHDAIAWIRKDGPELFKADPSRLVVAGASAGGYLAQMSGIAQDAPPLAIVSYWGYGDILGEWCTKPNSSFGGKQEPPTREEAFADIKDTPITQTTDADYASRGKLFHYMKSRGKWTEIVSGIDPLKSPEELIQFCPIRNLTPDFPPILLLHGTNDPDVPVTQSLEMHKALLDIGNDVELITVEGGGHGLWGGDSEDIENAFDRSLAFIREHLSPAQ